MCYYVTFQGGKVVNKSLFIPDKTLKTDQRNNSHPWWTNRSTGLFPTPQVDGWGVAQRTVDNPRTAQHTKVLPKHGRWPPEMDVGGVPTWLTFHLQVQLPGILACTPKTMYLRVGLQASKNQGAQEGRTRKLLWPQGPSRDSFLKKCGQTSSCEHCLWTITIALI